MNVFNSLKEVYLNNSIEITESLKQVYDLSKRIDNLSNHLIRTNQKDKSAKRALFRLVACRKRISNYMIRKQLPGYYLLINRIV